MPWECHFVIVDRQYRREGGGNWWDVKTRLVRLETIRKVWVSVKRSNIRMSRYMKSRKQIQMLHIA